MSKAGGKTSAAFRTIGEVSAELNIPQHILRFWESKFTRLRPVKRSGNRRYYRPEDVTLIQQIDHLLKNEGYTIAGVQRLLGRQGDSSEQKSGGASVVTSAEVSPPAAPNMAASLSGDARFDRAALQTIRDMLADAVERSHFSVT